MSSVPSYLWLSRHSIFYFRIVVPGVLRPLFPCSEIRRSLQTRCKREALIRGREKDPIRTVRGSGYSLDETFGRE